MPFFFHLTYINFLKSPTVLFFAVIHSCRSGLSIFSNFLTTPSIAFPMEKYFLFREKLLNNCYCGVWFEGLFTFCLLRREEAG